MIEFIIAFILGLVSIFSPCVLPVVPLIFAASRGKVLDLLLVGAGLLFNMTLVGMLAGTVSLTIFRYIAYGFMFFFGVLLIFNRPEIYRILARISSKFSVLVTKTSSFLLGFFLAFIWLPCIAPFIGVAFSQAILSSPRYSLIIMLFYGIGMITGMSLVLVAAKIAGRKLTIRSEIQDKMNRIAGILIIVYLLYFILRA